MQSNYNAFTIKQFKFGYILNNSNKMTSQDARILNQIEIEINNLVSRNKSLSHGFIDNTYYQLVINCHLSEIVKNILNQYNVGYYTKAKWCGMRKSTLITFDKIISRIISIPSRYNFKPIEHIVSNAIDIKLSSNTNYNSRHDYLISKNKSQARRLKGIYNS